MTCDRRGRRRFAGWLALALFGVAMAAGAEASPPNPSLIMSYEDYSRGSRTSPYVLEYKAGTGHLLIVGVAHAMDPNSDTVARIWSEWERYQPTLGFYEGDNWTPGFSEDVVGKFGEAAVVRFLALANRVPVTSVEPDMVEEIAHLQKSWGDEQIKLFFALRFVAERTGYGGTPVTEAEVSEYLRGGLPPTIGGPPLTIDELQSSYGRHFPAGTAWRGVPLQWFEPGTRARFTNEIATASGRFRDEYMLARLVERVRRGDRVFVALGYAHAYMLEPALTDALGKPLLKQAEP